MRFSVFTLFVVISLASGLIALNARTSITATEPYYAPLLGAVIHPPPYDMKEMAVSVHTDRGWPIWHTRATNHFAAHNAAAYMIDGGLQYDAGIPQTDYVRALADLAVAILVLGVAMIACETAFRLVWRKRRGEFIEQYASRP